MTSETFQQPLLQVAQLSVSFPSPQGLIEAVNALSFDVHAGEVLALVGESGSGKSVTARTLVGLAGAGAAVRAESLILHGHDGLSQNLLACDARRWQQLRGREIGFVLQDALTSLDPLRRIGQEVAEPLLTHRLERGAAVRERVAELLTQTGIPDPHNRMAQYAHELSGGLRQRALIASALAAGPRLLIADEPTTALDATVQKQVLNVFRALADAGHGVLLITHDLGGYCRPCGGDAAGQSSGERQGATGAACAATPLYPPSAGGHSLCRYEGEVVNRKRSAGSNGSAGEHQYRQHHTRAGCR